MADLYPTKTRLKLLRDVGVGMVYGRNVSGSTVYRSYVLREDRRGPGQQVTSRVDEMARAGWIAHGRREGASYFSRCPWVLTEAGRKVLEEADRDPH